MSIYEKSPNLGYAWRNVVDIHGYQKWIAGQLNPLVHLVLIDVRMGLDEKKKKFRDVNYTVQLTLCTVVNYKLQAILSNYSVNNKLVFLEAIAACSHTF